jgi:hypothetical protein
MMHSNVFMTQREPSALRMDLLPLLNIQIAASDIMGDIGEDLVTGKINHLRRRSAKEPECNSSACS